MASLREIIDRNNATFYDYRSNTKISTLPRTICIILIAILLATFFSKIDEKFVSAVITVQSILVGFSFSVLFFLVSSPQIELGSGSSLETSERVKKLRTLSKELFYNVSYYNVVTILSVILALAFLLPDIDNSIEKWKLVKFAQEYFDWNESKKSLFSCASKWVSIIFSSLFFFALVESIYTFYRTVKRVNFYFSEKLALNEKSENQQS